MRETLSMLTTEAKQFIKQLLFILAIILIPLLLAQHAPVLTIFITVGVAVIIYLSPFLK